MILVLGGSGYVGSAFIRALRRRGLAHRSLSRAEADYTGRGGLAPVLGELRPRFVINCAGFTGRPNVDACESRRAECLQGNAVLPGWVREACEAAGIPWGHVSSGCIYQGERPTGGGWREADAPNFSFRSPPCSFYSGSKALGEEVLAGADRCYIWRLRIPFDGEDHPRNYLSKLQRYERLLDARNSLSHRGDFAEACLDCWERGVPFGTYHVTNPGSVTTREVVAMIEASGVCRKDFRFFADEAEFMRLAASTPRSNCVLDTAKLAANGIRLRPVEEAIAAALSSWTTSASP